MIVTIVQAAVFLERQEEISIPIVPWFELGIGAQQIEGNRALVGCDSHSLLDRRNLHLPVRSMRGGMKVAIINKRFDHKVNSSTSSEKGVLNVRGILAVFHPDALFEQRVRKRIPPYRSGPLQPETLDVQIALGFDGAAGPAVCREQVIPAVKVRGFIQLGD